MEQNFTLKSITPHGERSLAPVSLALEYFRADL
jgi:hypothetical protein